MHKLKLRIWTQVKQKFVRLTPMDIFPIYYDIKVIVVNNDISIPLQSMNDKMYENRIPQSLKLTSSSSILLPPTRKKGALVIRIFSEYSNSGKSQCSQYLLRENLG